MSKILVVDSGSRGHALTESLAASPDCVGIWTTSDSPGVLEVAYPALTPQGKLIAPTDIELLRDFAIRMGIDEAVVGQEDPLALGIVNTFEEAHLSIFGPNQAATEIESSKVFATDIARELRIPMAERHVLETPAVIIIQAQVQGFPVVIKADKLAQGKGAKICNDLGELMRELDDLRSMGHFGKPGQQIVTEEYLEGPEISLHAWCDGETYQMFPFAMQDHKTIFDNDQGPMTGGMGVITPVPGLTPKDIEGLGRIFVAPVIKALKDRGWPFKGVLYPGIILTKNGPKLLEYNARPGGPETEAWIPRLQSDLLEVIRACNRGRLAEAGKFRWANIATACIVLAAEGYPDNTQKGAVIEGLEALKQVRGIRTFHGGIKESADGKMRVAGGRFLSVVGVGRQREPLSRVLNRGYEAADLIRIDRKKPQLRRDIGQKALSTAFQERVTETRHHWAT